MKYSYIALGLALFIGAGATPVPEASLRRLLARVETAPPAILNKQDGARRYEALEEWHHDKPPSAKQLNEKVAQFRLNVQDAHQQDPDPGKHVMPNVVAGQYHAKDSDAPGPGHIAYASTMSVEEGHRGIPQPEAFVEQSQKDKNRLLETDPKKLGKAEGRLQRKLKDGQTSIAHQTQPPSTVVGDPHKNFAKCAEAGTCNLIEQKYGKDVNMRGDKISAYGIHGIPGQHGFTKGHLPACTKANHKQFNCNGVAEIKGLDDVNRPGRPDSSTGNSPKPESPPRTPKRPLSPTNSPSPPGTPPKHYEQSTIASQSKQKDKVAKHARSLRRRALIQQAYLLDGFY